MGALSKIGMRLQQSSWLLALAIFNRLLLRLAGPISLATVLISVVLRRSLSAGLVMLSVAALCACFHEPVYNKKRLRVSLGVLANMLFSVLIGFAAFDIAKGGDMVGAGMSIAAALILFVIPGAAALILSLPGAEKPIARAF